VAKNQLKTKNGHPKTPVFLRTALLFIS